MHVDKFGETDVKIAKMFFVGNMFGLCSTAGQKITAEVVAAGYEAALKSWTPVIIKVLGEAGALSKEELSKSEIWKMWKQKEKEDADEAARLAAENAEAEAEAAREQAEAARAAAEEAERQASEAAAAASAARAVVGD